MTIKEIAVEVPVPAPAERVWAVLTDWPRQSDWMTGTRVAVVSGDGRSVGSRLFGFTGIADVGFLDVLEITEWTPPRRCRARHLGRLLRGSAEFTVEPRGAGAAVRWAERLDPPFGPIGALGLLLAAPLLRWGMRRSLRRLAATC